MGAHARRGLNSLAAWVLHPSEGSMGCLHCASRSWLCSAPVSAMRAGLSAGMAVGSSEASAGRPLAPLQALAGLTAPLKPWLCLEDPGCAHRLSWDGCGIGCSGIQPGRGRRKLHRQPLCSPHWRASLPLLRTIWLQQVQGGVGGRCLSSVWHVPTITRRCLDWHLHKQLFARPNGMSQAPL